LLDVECKKMEAALSLKEQHNGTLPSPACDADLALLDALRGDLIQQQRASQAAEQARQVVEGQMNQMRTEVEQLKAELEKQTARGVRVSECT
jgi:hypothetical protein